MKLYARVLMATLMLLSTNLFHVYATDPYPIRGLYVDKFLNWSGGYPTIDEAKTLLGRTAEEDSLLKFVRENNIKYLMLYDLSKIFAHPTATLPNSGGRTYEDALCDFMTKARTQYCVENIGAIIGGNQYLDSITDFSSLMVTDPYNFGTSTGFVPDSPNPLAYVETTYTAADGEIALRSEMVKTVLRINDFNSTCSSKFDLITTEYEFWQQWQSAGCIILDSIWYKTRDTLVYHGTPITTSITLDNTATITLPKDSINWDGAWRHYPVYLKFCKTNAQFWSYRTLLQDMVAAQVGATHPILLDTYLGWFQNDSINDIYQSNVIDSALDQVSIHTYHSNPNALWGYFDNRDSLFGHNNIDSTIVHPIFSSEPAFSGTSIAAGTSWFEIEKSWRTGYAANYAVWHHNNDSMMPGAVYWFAQSFFKTASGDTTYLKNKLFVRPTATCSGSNVLFDYVGPYEGGISFVWNYGDGSAIDSSYNLSVSSQDRNHTFNNSGIYIVSCTVYYPAPTDTGISGCSPYTYRDTVTITGAAISGSPLSFCYGGSVTLTATAGGGTYQWKKNGVNIAGATTNIYVADTTATFSVVVTGLPGCANSTASVSVTAFPKPEITATPTNVSCPSSCDGSVSTSISGGTSPFNYSWSPGGYTSSNISSVCINTYTVIVSDFRGCKDTASATVWNPSGNCDMGTDYCGTTYAHTIGTTFPTGSIGLHGNFIVDTNFTIRHNEVKIDSGVVITINSGKALTISDTSWLHACRKMWNGIVLTSGTSSLVIDSASTIEDADTVAKGNAGGSVRISHGDTIRRNLVGIALRTVSSNLIISGATFDCPTMLNDTILSKYTDTHVFLADADTIAIGDSTNQSVFINAKKGIDAARTWLTLYNLKIKIDTTVINPPDSASFGVKFIGSASTDYMLDMSNSNFNKIENYGYGVYSKLETLNQIWYNELTNCQYGVYLENIRDQRSDIRINTFSRCKKSSVYLYDISIGRGWIHVNENNINVGLSASSDMSEIGVRGENLTTYHTHVTVVYNNINNTRYGTRLTSYHEADISSNTITFPQDIPHAHSGEEYAGIFAEGSSGLTIDNNVITADSTPVAGMDTMFRGISLNLSTANTLQANYLGKMGAGLRILGNCNQSNLYCNTFDTCFRSVYYNNSGKLPQQGTLTQPNDNIFQANIDSLKFSGDATAHIASNWYFRGSETDMTNIYNPEPALPAIVFPIDSITSKHYKCDDVDDDGGGGGIGIGIAQSLAIAASGDTNNHGEYANEIRYMDKVTVYRVLVEDSTLMYQQAPTDEMLQNFVAENSETNIGYFDEVRTLGQEGEISSANNLNDAITDTNLIEFNTRTVNEIYFSATASDTLSLDSAQIESIQAIAYQNPVEGGEAVYRARAMLRIYIDDSYPGNSYRKSGYESHSSLIKKQTVFSIYPIPASNFFLIRNNDKEDRQIKFSIIDNTGRIVRSGNISLGEDILISTVKLFQGIYQLRLENSEVQEVHKLIIVK